MVSGDITLSIWNVGNFILLALIPIRKSSFSEAAKIKFLTAPSAA